MPELNYSQQKNFGPKVLLMLYTANMTVEQGCATFFVGGPDNQLQTSRWATRKI